MALLRHMCLCNGIFNGMKTFNETTHIDGSEVMHALST